MRRLNSWLLIPQWGTADGALLSSLSIPCDEGTATPGVHAGLIKMQTRKK